MEIDKLYNIITDNLENAAIKKFGSRDVFLKKNLELFDDQGYKTYGLKVPEIDKIVKNYTENFKQLSLDDRFKLSIKFYSSEFIAQTNFGLKLLVISFNDINPQNFWILDEIVTKLTH